MSSANGYSRTNENMFPLQYQTYEVSADNLQDMLNVLANHGQINSILPYVTTLPDGTVRTTYLIVTAKRVRPAAKREAEKNFK